MYKFEIDEILAGAIDMHVHNGPMFGPYRQDAMEIAQQQAEFGMSGVVFKDSGYLTAPIAKMINARLPDFTAVGSITLNTCHGGLNPAAVENAARLGSKVVWMPTLSAENSMAKYREMGINVSGAGISLIDEEGQLKPEIEPILHTIKEFNMVLATGHIGPDEIMPLVKRAHEIGIEKIILTHPFHTEVVESKVLTREQVHELVDLGAYIEHTFVFHLPTEMGLPIESTVELVKEYGAEHTIISTDLGLFAFNPTPAEGMRMFIAALTTRKVPAEDIRKMCHDNPAKLLDLE